MDSLLDCFFSQFHKSKKKLLISAAFVNQTHATFSWDKKNLLLSSNWYGQGFFPCNEFIFSRQGIKLKPIHVDEVDDIVTIPENEIFSRICSETKFDFRDCYLTESLIYNFVMHRFEVFDPKNKQTMMHVEFDKVTLFSKKDDIVTTYPIVFTQPHTAFIKVEPTKDTTFMIEFDTLYLRDLDSAKTLKRKIKAAKDNNLEKIYSLCKDHGTVDVNTYGTKSVVYVRT